MPGTTNTKLHRDTQQAKILEVWLIMQAICTIMKQTHLKQQPFQLLYAPAGLLHWEDAPLVFLAAPKTPNSLDLWWFISYQQDRTILGNEQHISISQHIIQFKIFCILDTCQIYSSRYISKNEAEAQHVRKQKPSLHLELAFCDSTLPDILLRPRLWHPLMGSILHQCLVLSPCWQKKVSSVRLYLSQFYKQIVCTSK